MISLSALPAEGERLLVGPALRTCSCGHARSGDFADLFPQQPAGARW